MGSAESEGMLTGGQDFARTLAPFVAIAFGRDCAFSRDWVAVSDSSHENEVHVLLVYREPTIPLAWSAIADRAMPSLGPLLRTDELRL
jgi:hypothetical protein